MTFTDRFNALRDMRDCLYDFLTGNRTRRAKRAELYAQFELGKVRGERDALSNLSQIGQWQPKIDTDPVLQQAHSTDNLPVLPSGRFGVRIHHLQQQTGTTHLSPEVYQRCLQVPAGATQSVIPAMPQQQAQWITSYPPQQPPLVLRQPAEKPTWVEQIQQVHDKQQLPVPIQRFKTRPLNGQVRKQMMQQADTLMQEHGSVEGR